MWKEIREQEQKPRKHLSGIAVVQGGGDCGLHSSEKMGRISYEQGYSR